ncbi:MAG: ABC transporter ATP-binding protein [Clostridia bacterium]|nr:ABC transporter ATP-binding protein [Clostridia bacterium]
MIELKNVSKYYGGVAAVENISVKLQNGRIYAVVGPDGAGKSTLLGLLAGSLEPDEGTVKINGFDMSREPLSARQCVGYLPKDALPYGDMTPLEYLLFVAEARGLSYGRSVRRANDALELAGLEREKDRLISSLSSGMRRRLAVVQAAVGKNDILILDAPTAELDIRRSAEVLELIRELAQGKTVILSCRDPKEALGIGEHILLLSNGKLVASQAVEDAAGDLEERFRLLKEENAPVSPVRRKRLVPERDGEYEVIDTDEERGGDGQ